MLPWLGTLIYLIAWGGSMNTRAQAKAQQNEELPRQYVQVLRRRAVLTATSTRIPAESGYTTAFVLSAVAMGVAALAAAAAPQPALIASA